MSVSVTDSIRELDHRSVNGIEVILAWYPESNTVAVHVFDARTGTAFRADLDPADAADAFRHPFAYVAGAIVETARHDELDRAMSIC